MTAVAETTSLINSELTDSRAEIHCRKENDSPTDVVECLTLDDNGKTLRICDPDSMVCTEREINVVGKF